MILPFKDRRLVKLKILFEMNLNVFNCDIATFLYAQMIL